MMTCLALVVLGGGRSGVPGGAQRWRAALGAVHGCQNSESDLSHVRSTCGGRAAQRPSASIRPVWLPGHGARTATDDDDDHYDGRRRRQLGRPTTATGDDDDTCDDQ